ncbi:MAG: hypothetical protein IPI58_08755 [Alphaproteobacteria bacterium]|nr:MAG: hypothetical protein IPI58_08755 [Alphaproteobacteria bacterium]
MTTESVFENILTQAFPIEPVPECFFQNPEDATSDLELPLDLREKLMGRRWTDVAFEDWRWIGGLSTKRCYMTPEAYHYYLPSLLLQISKNKDWVVYGVDALLPGEKFIPELQTWSEYSSVWWKNFTERFNVHQREVVRIYLKDVELIEPADLESIARAKYALDNIWIERPQGSVTHNPPPRP